jgi:hypothetical protein
MLLNQIKAKSKRSSASFDSPDDWNEIKRQRLIRFDKPGQVHLDLDLMQTQSHVLAIYPQDEVMVTGADDFHGFLDHNFWKISPGEYLQSLENAMF